MVFVFSDEEELEPHPTTPMRPASRGSRDEVFQRAMTLMSNRCCSARGEGVALYSDREPPFGVHIPQYFYVQQIRPAPMAPLKVWRGYKGNVYFEPMTINGVHKESAESSESAENQVLCVDGKRRSTPSSNIPTSKRATTAGTSNKSYRYVNSSPQVFVMDKQAVIKSINSNTNQELKFIEGTESTGSLAVRPASSGTYGGGLRNRSSNKRVLPKRDRIYRGSNFHSTNGNVGSSSALARSDTDTSRRSFQVCSKSANRKQYSRSAGPMSRLRALQSNSHVDLFVSGGKFSPPTVMSPLLRTTAQFAIGSGSHCLSMDSHENIHDYESLPPLDQVRVSLGHIELEADNPTCLYSGRSDYENTPKPFTEYSPRVTAQ